MTDREKLARREIVDAAHRPPTPLYGHRSLAFPLGSLAFAFLATLGIALVVDWWNGEEASWPSILAIAATAGILAIALFDLLDHFGIIPGGYRESWRSYIEHHREETFIDWARWREGTLDYAEFLEEEIGRSEFSGARLARLKGDRDAFHMYVLNGWKMDLLAQNEFMFEGARLFRYRDQAEKRTVAREGSLNHSLGKYNQCQLHQCQFWSCQSWLQSFGKPRPAAK